MEIIPDAMEGIKYTWPCIVEVKDSVVQAMEIPGTEDESTAQNPLKICLILVEPNELVVFGARLDQR